MAEVVIQPNDAHGLIEMGLFAPKLKNIQERGEISDVNSH